MASRRIAWESICRTTLGVLALPLMACGARSEPALAPRAPAPSVPEVAKPVAERRTGRAIFDEALARERWPQLLPNKKARFWTPSMADVLALERQLPEFLRSQPEDSDARAADLWLKAPSYLRQYVGFTRNGRRVVYANFFCFRSVSDRDWHVWPVVVDDGGPCFFQVEYDVESGRFSRLSVNGRA